jgi:hypothetical protein
MLHKLKAEAIRGLVSALPDSFRELIVLHELEDLSYREIAGIVGVPVGTVMSRLARGRAMLRQAWLKAGRGEKMGIKRRVRRSTPRKTNRLPAVPPAWPCGADPGPGLARAMGHPGSRIGEVEAAPRRTLRG